MVSQIDVGDDLDDPRIRILFRCWQERTPYDEIRYLKSLQKRRSPLLQYLTQPTTQAA